MIPCLADINSFIPNGPKKYVPDGGRKTMVQATNRNLSFKALLAVTVLASCAALMLDSAPAAKASASPYCGGWLGYFGMCIGERRSLEAVEGMGEQHSVCVWIGDGGGGIYGAYGCSSGPGAWVYRFRGCCENLWPVIQNNAAGNNFVHGWAYG